METKEDIHSQAEPKQKDTRKGQFEVARRELHLRRKRRRQILSNLKILENKLQIYALRYKDIFTNSVKNFKSQDSRICGECIKEAGILH